jgi:hypothetical protein
MRRRATDPYPNLRARTRPSRRSSPASTINLPTALERTGPGALARMPMVVRAVRNGAWGCQSTRKRPA